MSKYLVTGHCGFVGSAISRRLTEMGHTVIGIDNKSTNGEMSDEYEKYSKAISFQDDLSKTQIKDMDVEAVFHAAAKPRVQFSIDNPRESHEANVDSTLNLLELCRSAGIKKFIYSASSSAYGDQDKLPLVEDMTPNPMSPYALQKLVGEYYCKLYSDLYGMKCVSLRYFNVYGPMQNPTGGYPTLVPKFALMMLKGEKPIINGSGDQTRDFTYIDDVVDANIAALNAPPEADGEVFNIGNSKNVSVNWITRALPEILELENVPIKYGPAVVEPLHTLACTQKAKKILGWEPKVSMQEGLKKAVLDIKDRYGDHLWNTSETSK